MRNFTPLTEEQYNRAIQAGFSSQDIIDNELRRKQEAQGAHIGQVPSLYGGAVKEAAKSGYAQAQAGQELAVEGASTLNPRKLLQGTLGLTAGAINTVAAPVAPLFAPVGKAIDFLSDKISNNKKVQKFADSPAGEGASNLAEMITNAATIAGGVAPLRAGAPKVGSAIKAGAKAITPEVVTTPVDVLRADKLRSGYLEQNTRLKSVDNAFKKNTKSYKEGGETKTVTPVDTLMKYNIAPEVEKGTIRMGDYHQGTGALGQLHERVMRIDEEIDTTLKNSETKQRVDDLRENAIKQAQEDPDLKASGKVQKTVTQLNSIFDDFKQSYGEEISATDINTIRKVMNRDFSPDTVDTSRIIGDAAREVVYNVTDDQVVKGLLRQQGELLSAKKYAEAMNGTKVTGGRLGNYMLRTAGAIAGSTTNLPVVGPVLGAIGGEYAARLLQQSQFKSLSAETKAMFTGAQSLSKRNQQTTSAKTTPSTIDIPPSIPAKREGLIDRVKNTPNKQGGFINPSGKRAVRIHSEDVGEMRDFTDYVAGEYKPSPKEAHQLELAASRIAEHYFPDRKLPKTNQGIANFFARVLEKIDTKKKRDM